MTRVKLAAIMACLLEDAARAEARKRHPLGRFDEFCDLPLPAIARLRGSLNRAAIIVVNAMADELFDETTKENLKPVPEQVRFEAGDRVRVHNRTRLDYDYEGRVGSVIETTCTHGWLRVHLDDDPPRVSVVLHPESVEEV